MAYKTLIFGIDDMFNTLKPYYMQAVQQGVLDIVGFAVLQPNGISFVTPQGKRGGGGTNSSIRACNNFFA